MNDVETDNPVVCTRVYHYTLPNQQTKRGVPLMMYSKPVKNRRDVKDIIETRIVLPMNGEIQLREKEEIIIGCTEHNKLLAHFHEVQKNPSRISFMKIRCDAENAMNLIETNRGALKSELNISSLSSISCDEKNKPTFTPLVKIYQGGEEAVHYYRANFEIKVIKNVAYPFSVLI
jgi:hypothetical protein